MRSLMSTLPNNEFSRLRGRTKSLLSIGLIVFAVLTVLQDAFAHGIAGNRLFSGTLTFDDPAVADEAILPNLSYSTHPDGGANVTTIVSVGHFFAFSHQPSVSVSTVGGSTAIGVVQIAQGSIRQTSKSKERHSETMRTRCSYRKALAWAIGRSGAQGVGASVPNAIEPGIFFGKGFGDLPDSLAWLRPFAITGALTLEHPITGSSTNFGIDPQTGWLGPMLAQNADTLHWGFRSNSAHCI